MKGLFRSLICLAKQPPAVVDGDAKIYAAVNNPEIECDKIAHFALGIFWKATVHSWRGGVTEPLIDFGTSTEGIRRYLKGEDSFPSDAVLMIGVLPKPVKHISFVVPYQGSTEARNNFLFYALGIEFTLLIGDKITAEERSTSFSGNPNKPILVVDFAPMLQDIAVDVMKKAHKAKNV